ncbi:arginase [Haloechinothrix alba]|uniref:Arginase n=1 Tax=Haloechinothrix alba TaxID=664784 RepID=A0A238Y6D7_9PSEU|nr:arginase family protein [Haloechinothrix alba]SNR66836.1 arginase [Haloechinothrix alba]
MRPLLVPYHLDEHLPGLDVPVDASTTIEQALGDGTPWERMAQLYDAVAEDVAATARHGTIPMVLSSDCTTSLGTVAGLQRAGTTPSIVWFDAHGDLQTLETSHSGYLGGIPLRVLLGYRPELISDTLGLHPIEQHRTVLVDGRDLDPPEREFLETSPVQQRSVAELTSSTLPDGPIYLHVDLDVLRKEDVPDLILPTDGGPSASVVDAALAEVLASDRVVAVGLACTWHPQRGSAERVARLCPSLFG